MTINKTIFCKLCGKEHVPSSPKQKYCEGCRMEGKRIKDRERDKKRSRIKYTYIEREVVCPACGKTFKTHYSKKVYCGSAECEKIRINLKNHNIHLKRNKQYLLDKGRLYYSENKEKCCLKKAEKYRELYPEVMEYVPGKIHNHTVDYVKEYIENSGYRLLSEEYINNREKILLECPCGHLWETTFHNFKDGGARCFTCYINGNYTSRFELEVRDFISKIYFGNVVYNDRSIVFNPESGKFLELDIYFPDLNKAIECDGVYWHSLPGMEDKDTIKSNFCLKNNIDLLRIMDTEWDQDSTKLEIIKFIYKGF